MANSSSSETEIKLAVPDGAHAGLALLQTAGFMAQSARLFEANTMVDQAGEPLRAARCLLRIRECGGKTILTYKGPPDTGSRHKTREELEVNASDAARLMLIFDRLGYRAVYRYEKFRTEFTRAGQPGVATLDETPIGVFLELEGPPDWIDATAMELGFRVADYITNSYASLHRQYCEERGLAVGEGMVFANRST